MDARQEGRTRREAIKTLGVGIAAIGLGSRSRRAAAQTPKPGGTVRVARPTSITCDGPCGPSG